MASSLMSTCWTLSSYGWLGSPTLKSGLSDIPALSLVSNYMCDVYAYVVQMALILT